MAFKNLIAFGAGEITPELYERGNLDKFRTGLRKLRNAIVTKMGGLQSRPGSLFFHETKDGAKAKFLYVQSLNYLFEFTESNLRLYTGYDPEFDTFDTTADLSLALFPTMDDISPIHFTHGNRYLYIFSDGFETLEVDMNLIVTSPSTAVTQLRNHINPPNPWHTSSVYSYAAGGTAPTGYDIDYAVTFVQEGVETFITSFNQTRKKPVVTGEFNTISVVITKATLPAGTLFPDEFRVYQRPRDGGSYLFVGVASNPVETALIATYTFKDFGVAPVAEDRPPEYVSQFVADTKTPSTPPAYIYPITAKTGLVYQDRLIFSGSRLKNRVFGTRTGVTAMTRDFPLQADSAVSFKCGSDGGLSVNRFYDGSGLMIFTSVGVFITPSDQLTPETAFGIKRAPYIADEAINPIQLGGHVTIYDRRLKAVIGLVPAGNYDGYAYNEFSIYSAHLLKGRKIVSWAKQESITSVVWMVLDDGKVLSFSFQDEQLVRSWAWHDFQDGLAEEVFVMDTTVEGKDVVCFSVIRDGVRYVERLTDRDADFLSYVGTDASVFYKENYMVSSVVTNAIVAPVVSGEWDGPLTITPDFGGFGTPIGQTIRIYTNKPYEYIDMEVDNNAGGILTVTPESEYPSTQANLTLEDGVWKVFKTLDGLNHLIGKKVSVRLDGFTHASPLNTDPDKSYEEYTVSGAGEVILHDDYVGAFISVGLPIVTDIQTLDIDTVEQSPVKLEGQIVNNLWLSYFESLFLYAAASYPDDDTVDGMDVQEFQVEEDPDIGIINTVPPLPQDNRLEVQIRSDWKTKGSVALRNVDPQPVALRAIIPDTEVIPK